MESEPGPTDDARHRRCSPGQADRVVQGLRLSGRARARRAFSAVRQQYDRPRLARAAGLFQVWRPGGRFRGERDASDIRNP